MVARFGRIYRVFGVSELIRTLILLVGLILMAVLGVAMHSSITAAEIAVGGLAIGWVLRNQIAQGAEYCAAMIRVGLVTYAIVLAAGSSLGLAPNLKLLIITATTVIIFNLRFWSLSDPGVFREVVSGD